jgi:hypothetical protein
VTSPIAAMSAFTHPRMRFMDTPEPMHTIATAEIPAIVVLHERPDRVCATFG